MADKKLDRYNPNFTYKKEDIDIDKNTKNGYPILERVNNAGLYPEAIKNSVDMEQLNSLD